MPRPARPGPRIAALEPLEGRALLSTIAPTKAVHAEVEVSHAKAGLEKAAVVHHPAHAALKHATAPAKQAPKHLSASLLATLKHTHARPDFVSPTVPSGTSTAKSAGYTPSASAPLSTAYGPAQLRHAYGTDAVTFTKGDGTQVAGDGAGETIAIVDAFGDAKIASDLAVFDKEYKLPAANLTVVSESGSTTRLPNIDPSGGWEVETSIDVEWAHATAPKAKILLVQATTSSFADLDAAVLYAANHADVVSMSYGGGETYDETALDNIVYSHPGVVFVASSGDGGAPPIYPAISPNVVAVGGTSLYLNPDNTRSFEAGWDFSGGGVSTFEPLPAYQAAAAAPFSSFARTNPDLSFDADPNTGVSVYDSNVYEYSGFYGWSQFGGTSIAAPQIAGLIAIADQGRHLAGESPLNATDPQQALEAIYNPANAGAFYDVTAGFSFGNPIEYAGPGYDLVTGQGSPQTSTLFVTALIDA